MENKEYQVENGNYTRIINSLLDNLIKIPFKGCELALAMFIIRKTYGYHKTKDRISLTQFCKGINKTKPAVIIGLKNLILVKVAILVEKGNTKGVSNMWSINKYHTTWELVKVANLVKHKHEPSKAEALNLVKVALHTKDIKNNTKDNTIVVRKTTETAESLPTEEKKPMVNSFLVEEWNKHPNIPNSLIPVKNTTVHNVLLRKCRKLTPDIEKAWEKLVKEGYTEEDYKIAIEKYIEEIKGRDTKNDYCRHRFSLYDFLKQGNGFRKFINY